MCRNKFWTKSGGLKQSQITRGEDLPLPKIGLTYDIETTVSSHLNQKSPKLKSYSSIFKNQLLSKHVYIY